MRNISPIKQRILQLLEKKGITKYKFYKETGISRGILDKPGGLSEDNIVKLFAYFPNLDMRWMLLGEDSSVYRVENQVNGKSDAYSRKNRIPVLSLDESAECDFESILYYLPLMPSFQSNEDLLAFQVESLMMFPTINLGDVTVCSRVWNMDLLEEGEIYVIKAENYLLGNPHIGIRRIKFSDDGKKLELYCDNKSYGKMLLPIKKVDKIWKVVTKITSNFSNEESLEHRIMNLEHEVAQLRSKLK